MTYKIRKYLRNDDLIFYIVSLLFSLILCFANMFGDDITGMRPAGSSISAYWKTATNLYGTWSSRVLVNFIIFIFTDNAKIWWAAYMGVSLFILMKAFSLLFADENKKTCNNFISCIVMLYTFQDLSSAGWIATSTTYLSPMAFGMMALVPIKKMLKGEKLKRWEYLAYILCLIYGANNEQMMIVILAAYASTFIYCLVKKSVRIFNLVLFEISIGSCFFIMTSPGNFKRLNLEIISWFPTYDMLDNVDKAELGYSTTVHWILFTNKPFILFSCIIFTILIWGKYKDKFYRILSMIPLLSMIILGPLKEITFMLWPSLEKLTNGIPYYGLVTAENRGNLNPFGKFLFMGIIIIIIGIEILLLSNDLYDFIVCMVLLSAGVASRIVMGFSPTIYASSDRTFTIMSFCIIAVCILQYVNNKDKLPMILRKNQTYILNTILGISICNLLFYVGSQIN